MQTIEAKFVINTPMFLGGAKPEKTAEIRIASIKGAIRFWWRALAYARHNGVLAKMKAEEDRIFGSTSGQAEVRFSLKSTEQPKITTTNAKDVLEEARVNLGLRYLGYGVIESFDGQNTHAGRLVHPCINAGSSFILYILTKKYYDSTFLDALQLFGLVGCLGSRARKGYGSITLLSYKIFKNKIEESHYVNPPPAEYKDSINALLKKNGTHIQTSLPKISAFYKQTPIYQLSNGSDATELLSHYGLMMLRYRSAGRGGEINDQLSSTYFNSEQRFMRDHDWHKDKYNRGSRYTDFHPERTAFGLPHSYFSRMPIGQQDIKNEVTTQHIEKYGRRASPLFFHVHKFPDNSYSGIALIMKSDFLPGTEKIKADGTNVPQDINYDFLTQFLTGFIRNEPGIDTEEHYFPGHQLIFPLENQS